MRTNSDSTPSPTTPRSHRMHTSNDSPSSPTTPRSHRTPFPHTVEVGFDPGTTKPTLLFNFTHSARGRQADILKAGIFHNSCPADTHYSAGTKIVELPLPSGIKRLYFARAGNVGLEFASRVDLEEFQKSIMGVGHVCIREVAELFKVYLGDKRIPEEMMDGKTGAGAFRGQSYGGAMEGVSAAWAAR